MTVFENFTQDFKDKKVLIFGLGSLGRGLSVTKIFSEIGAQVKVTDKKDVSQLTYSLEQLKQYNLTYTLGEHKSEDIEWADVIIRNASVPWNHELLNHARSLKKVIKMDACLFFEYTQSPHTIGVTGTRGKSTITQLIYQLLKDNQKNVFLAGNIYTGASIEYLKTYDPQAWYVFELSSWQLQAFHDQKVSPHIAVLNNLYPDHLLDRTYQEYMNDKTAIFKYQKPGDYLVINRQDSDTADLSIDTQAQVIEYKTIDCLGDINLTIKGRHNQTNVAAVIKVASILGIKNIRPTLESFTGLPYRLEQIYSDDSIKIINDSASTTPIAVQAALDTFPDSILLVGGTSKKLPTQEMIDAINSKTHQVIFLEGTGTSEIVDQIDPSKVVSQFSDFRQAIETGLALSRQQRKTLLFSPGFTSFGMFINEFDRGQQFNSIVKELTHEKKT